MTNLRFDLVFPRFKLLSGAERAILGLAGPWWRPAIASRVVCHQFDRSCLPHLAPGVEIACSNLRLDWSRNRYLNAALDYGRCFQLRRLLDPKADVQMLFGPSLPLVWYLRKVRPSDAVVLYYVGSPPRALYQDRELVLTRLGWSRTLVTPLLGAYAWLDRRLVEWPDGVCTSSPFAAEHIQRCYGRPATVITLGVTVLD